jgi:acyl-[acyl carrier protein]--UDP-N-acetylglucosamine O-acyltransferase
MGEDAEVGKDYFVGRGVPIDQDAKTRDFSISRGNSVTALYMTPYSIWTGESTVVGINVKTSENVKFSQASIALLEFCFSKFYKRTAYFKQRVRNMLRDGSGSSEDTIVYSTEVMP